jgi:very-short-patch-repair endonuclease
MVLAARALRRCLSVPEAMLWQALRTRPGGLKFRLQHPVTRYILDFYCAAASLAIEVDGESHSMGDRPARDAIRDRTLAEQGVHVVRFAAVEVMSDLDAVVTAIVAECRARIPPHREMGRGTTRRVVEG